MSTWWWRGRHRRLHARARTKPTEDHLDPGIEGNENTPSPHFCLLIVFSSSLLAFLIPPPCTSVAFVFAPARASAPPFQHAYNRLTGIWYGSVSGLFFFLSWCRLSSLQVPSKRRRSGQQLAAWSMKILNPNVSHSGTARHEEDAQIAWRFSKRRTIIGTLKVPIDSLTHYLSLMLNFSRFYHVELPREFRDYARLQRGRHSLFRHAVGFCENENPSVVLKLTNGVFLVKNRHRTAVPMKEGGTFYIFGNN